jgi:hypothetical protein
LLIKQPVFNAQVPRRELGISTGNARRYVDPTADQRRAFDLLNTPIPLTAAAEPEQAPHQTDKSPGQPRDLPISTTVTSG